MRLFFSGRTFFQMRNGPSMLTASMGMATPVVIHQLRQETVAPIRARGNPFRAFGLQLRINLSQVVNFLFRMVFIILIFSQHLSRLKIALLCGVVSLIYLMQNQIIRLPAIWRPEAVVHRAPPAGVPNASEEARLAETETEPEPVAEPEPERPQGIVGEACGLVSTFLGSLIPSREQGAA